MGYETIVVNKPNAPTTYKDKLKEWVTSDCKNKACIDGYMSTPDGAMKCPICTRLDAAYPEYAGPIEMYTDDEMSVRLKDRKDVYFDKEYRYKRGIEVIGLLKSIAGNVNRDPF